MRVAALLLAAFVVAVGILACSSFSAGTADGGSEASSTDAAVLPKDCKAILAMSPSSADGFYPIARGDGGSVKVYCDMTTADGGWTLIGRSAANGDVDASFGWTSGQGNPDDEVTPYSANAAALGLQFTEILFGTRADAGRVWSTPIYTTPVDSTFLTDCADAACPTQVTTVDGGCSAPGLLTYDGFTTKQHGFYFRDVPNVDIYGLDPNGWFTSGRTPPDCAEDALLDQSQGMIFVR